MEMSIEGGRGGGGGGMEGGGGGGGQFRGSPYFHPARALRLSSPVVSNTTL